MKPIEFPEQNVIYAKDHPQYKPLPAHRTICGQVTSCWQLTPEEIEEVKLTGKIFLTQSTFNQALQPVMLKTDF